MTVETVKRFDTYSVLASPWFEDEPMGGGMVWRIGTASNLDIAKWNPNDSAAFCEKELDVIAQWWLKKNPHLAVTAK